MKMLFRFHLLLVLIAASILSCEDNQSTTTSKTEVNVDLKNTEDYRHDLKISGDEEGASIKTQAQHFQTSTIVRDSSTNWSTVYFYKPDSGYVGEDYVEIETCTGGNGVNCSDIEIININFNITD